MNFNFDLSNLDFLSNPLLGWLVAILLIIWIVRDFVKNFPLFLKFKAIFYIPIARRLHFRRLEKEAIKCDIQGTVNYAVNSIIEELPEGSLKPLEIQYIEKSEVESFIKQGKIFVRIRPVKSEDENFLNVIQIYLELALIPDSKKLLDDKQKKAITYFTTTRLITGHKTLINKLHDDYYSKDISSFPEIKDYFEKISYIDRRGLFFSVVIRIIELSASRLRFSQGNLNDEFNKVIDHVVDFIKNLKSKNKKENVWKFINPFISFSILLVAKPVKAFIVKPSSYVNRLKDNLKSTNWVFVVFSRDELKYGLKVARAIELSGLVDLADSVTSCRDYRCKQGGIIKIYAKKNKLKIY